jgi:hypothetical protein
LSSSFNFLMILRNSSCASGSVSFSLELLDISASNHQPVDRLTQWGEEILRVLCEAAESANTTEGPDFSHCQSAYFLVFPKKIL